jgi:hypothetical protein
MKREILVNEIINFCDEYKVFNNSISKNEIKNMIEIWLNDTSHIESLINTIIKTSYHVNMDKEKLKTLLLELERIRLELEYKE